MLLGQQRRRQRPAEELAERVRLRPRSLDALGARTSIGTCRPPSTHRPCEVEIRVGDLPRAGFEDEILGERLRPRIGVRTSAHPLERAGVVLGCLVHNRGVLPSGNAITWSAQSFAAENVIGFVPVFSSVTVTRWSFRSTNSFV